MAQYYNRCTQFSINGQSQTVPFVTIPSKTTDKKVIYKLGKSRMDKYSEEYFNEYGIDFKYFESSGIKYKQIGNSFIPDLSILDYAANKGDKFVF